MDSYGKKAGKGALIQEEKSATLEVAQPVTATYGMGGNNQPLVVLMDAYQHHGWRENGVCGTLTAGNADKVRGDTPLVICMATQQGGAEILEDKSPTITATAGMSGNNQPVICLQGNGIDRADTVGCNGRGWTENVSYTLNTIDRPAVAYCIGNGQVHDAVQMEKEICKTLNCMNDSMTVMIRK